MKILACQYNIHDEHIQLIRTFPKKQYWLVELWATHGVEKIEKFIKNKDKAELTEFSKLILDEFTENVSELSPITDGGFKIYLLKRTK